MVQGAQSSEQSIIEIYGTVREINDVATSIAASVTQQQMATSKIARSMETVSSNAARVRDSVALMRENAENTSGSSLLVKQGSTEVSTAFCTIEGNLNLEPGSPVEFECEEFNASVRARVAVTEGSRTTLQFPLDLDYIAELRTQLGQKMLAAA